MSEYTSITNLRWYNPGEHGRFADETFGPKKEEDGSDNCNGHEERDGEDIRTSFPEETPRQAISSMMVERWPSMGTAS